MLNLNESKSALAHYHFQSKYENDLDVETSYI